MARESPLGKPARHAKNYTPEALFVMPRSDARDTLQYGPEMPFRGQDIWNAWELTWLDLDGKPVVGTAVISFDAMSTNIVESKSLKLYLDSFAMSRYESATIVRETIVNDLRDAAAGNVVVEITTAAESTTASIVEFSGTCLDNLIVVDWPEALDASVLACDAGAHASEELYSHLLRSNCPVTHQPDSGSILIRYAGPKIDPASLLRYIVSYRTHNDFHEACVERIFIDIRNQCATNKLSVYARYNRRGGLDINPFRTDADETPENMRLWRQ